MDKKLCTLEAAHIFYLASTAKCKACRRNSLFEILCYSYMSSFFPSILCSSTFPPLDVDKILDQRIYDSNMQIKYRVLFTAKYKTRSKLPTPWHFCKIKISNLVIISDPMGESFKFLLATPKFFASSMGKSLKIKLATLCFLNNPTAYLLKL